MIRTQSTLLQGSDERNGLTIGFLPKVARKRPSLLISCVLDAAGCLSCLLLLLHFQVAAAQAQPDSPTHDGQGVQSADGRAQDLPEAPMPKVIDRPMAIRRLPPKPPELAPCRTVFVSSDNPAFADSDLQMEALFTPEFINKRYILVNEPERADASVHLSSSDDSGDHGGTDLLLVTLKTSDEGHEYFRPKVDNASQIVHEILILLSSLCKTAESDEAESGVGAQTKLSQEEISAKLQAVTCIRAISKASQMDVKLLTQELARRPEFAEWAVKVTSVEGPGCVDVVVKHQRSTRTWTFQLDEPQTGATLDSGAVFVFEDQRAASRIAAAVAKQIALWRPRPPSSSSTVLTAADREDRLRIPGGWQIKILPQEPVREPSKELRLSLEGSRLVGKTKGGEVVFAIPTRYLVDVAIEERHGMPLSAAIALDAEEVGDLGNGCADDHCAFVAAAVVAMDVTLFTADVVGSMIGRLKGPKRIMDVAWRENGEIRTAEWQISKGDWKALFATMEGVITEHNSPSEIR